MIPTLQLCEPTFLFCWPFLDILFKKNFWSTNSAVAVQGALFWDWWTRAFRRSPLVLLPQQREQHSIPSYISSIIGFHQSNMGPCSFSITNNNECMLCVCMNTGMCLSRCLYGDMCVSIAGIYWLQARKGTSILHRQASWPSFNFSWNILFSF